MPHATGDGTPAGGGRGFPWATFLTNLSGSFLLGLLLVVLLERLPPRRRLRPFPTTGILGAFTTMSTHELETALLLKDRLAEEGDIGDAARNAVASLLVGLAAVSVGLAIAAL